jgi:hypothetical protein
MNAVEQFEVQGLTVKLYRDEDVESPRTDMDNLGTMITWHRNYRLGDEHEFESPAEFQTWAKANDVALIIPLYLYDHSGITMRASGDGNPFHCPWDSGQVGYTYITRTEILKEYGGSRLSKKKIEQARKLLVSEVETYDQFLTGDIYGYTITDADGNDVDSCWGFYGFEYAKQEAESQAKYFANSILESEANAAGDVPCPQSREVA